MYKTYGYLERKPYVTVMGAGQSVHTHAVSVLNPFPVDAKLSHELDKLSMVAARILNTSDIYDIANLALSDASGCGSYAIFLKKK